MRVRELLAGVVLLLISTAVLNQAQVDAVDEYVRAEMQKQHIPGLALLVARQGKPIRAQRFGLRTWNFKFQ